MEKCKLGLMRKIVWKCGNLMGGLLWISSPPFIKFSEKYKWNVRTVRGTMGSGKFEF